MNPYRDVTIGIELGARVREAMMTQHDWNELLHWWARGQRIGVFW